MAGWLDRAGCGLGPRLGQAVVLRMHTRSTFQLDILLFKIKNYIAFFSHLHIIWVVSRNIVGSAGLTLSEASYELEMLVLVNLGNIVISICM